jgi:hypothetical protein
MGINCSKKTSSFECDEKPATSQKQHNLVVIGEPASHLPNDNHEFDPKYMYITCLDYQLDKMLDLQKDGFQVYDRKGSAMKLRKLRYRVSDHRFATVSSIWISGHEVTLGKMTYCSYDTITRDVVKVNGDIRIPSITLDMKDGTENYVSSGASYVVTYFDPSK